MENRSAETLVELQLQARREEFAQGSSRYLLRIFVAVSLLLGGVWLLAPMYPQILIYAFLLLLLGLGAGLYPALQRRNRTTAGVYLLIGVTLLVAFLSPVLLPSLMPTTPFMVIIGILVAMLLLGERRSRGWVSAFVLAYLVDVVVIGILSWSPFPPLPHSANDEVFGAVSVFGILTAVISVRLMLAAQEQQFRRAQRLNLELEQRIQEVDETQGMFKRERTLLRTLIDAIPANVYIKDPQSRFVDANLETALQMGVKTANDLIGKTDFDFFSAALAKKYFADEQIVFHSGQPLRNLEESNFDQRSQQKSWFLTTKVPILDEQGEVSGLVGVGFDITERKQVQEQIAQERTLLRTLIDHLPDYIFIKDAEGRFVNSNAAHNRAAHVEQAEALRGKSALEVFPADLAAQYQADDQQVLQLGQALVNVERTSVAADGQKRIMLTTKVPLHDAAGKVTGLVGISRDITERKQAEQQALELRNERQRAQVLHQFIGDATHDLMTPIAIINTSTDLARRALTPERLKAHLDKIERMSETLQSRLQQMLTMSQLDMMTAADLERREVDLAQLLQGLGGTFRASAEAKAQHLNVEIDPQAGTLQVDDLYLGMALGKIIENAIHYTDNGGTICISIARHEAQVAITVRDTGIGISEADLAHIFERFYRAKSHRPLEAGAGLGLSIAQRIIELHGGRIEVSSIVGSGSTFTILLPSAS